MPDRNGFRVFATANIGDDALNVLRNRGYDVEVYSNSEPPPKRMIIEKLRAGVDGLITTLREHALVIGEVTLTSGRTAQYYVDVKRAILLPAGFNALAELVAEEAKRLGATAVGGTTMGADPIASAVSLTSFLADRPIPAFYVRKEPKGHGTQQWVEGRKGIPDGSRVCVVEDVVTTGGSTLRAVERCRAEGLDVRGVVALVDRQEGGREAVEAAGMKLRSLFLRSDFP